MANKQKVCIIGGGASGVALLWTLSQDPNSNCNVTLIHDQPNLGGHSNSPAVKWNGKTFNVDIGVQFISPMLYPNVHDMLKKPEFKSRVSVTDYDTLKVAAAFPRDAKNNMMNWGNFPDYQPGSNNPQSSRFNLFDADMMYDCELFQDFLEISIAKWANVTLTEFFKSPPPPLVFKNQQRFLDYFLSPYLSIINGYGNALMESTTMADLWPLFAKIPFEKTPQGSFTKPGTGWQRFTNGAQSWVQAMADVAQSHAPSTIILNSSVLGVYTDQNTGQVHVNWQSNTTKQILGKTFDKVVLTTDMWTNSKLLNNTDNAYFWKNLYEKYIGYPETPNGPDPVWDLMWGKCYIHSDASMLSPDLRLQKETLQFTASYAPGNQDGNYNLSKTFTTYIQKNVLNDPAADGLYLTMYGYVPNPTTDKVPAQNTWLTPPITWTHGKWTPAFMGGAKANLHLAQGLGSIPYPGQMNTNVYFAGNNATADSEEGALDSAMIIAEYAFNVPYPLPSLSPMAWFMYETFHNTMFPKPNAASSIARMIMTAPRQSGAIIAPAPVKTKAAKSSVAKKAKKPSKKARPAKKAPSKKVSLAKKAKPVRAKKTSARSAKVQAKKAKPTRTKPAKTSRRSPKRKKTVVRQARKK